MPPRVSVVVTTYNRTAKLHVAVASILASEHDSFELVVADQNSEEGLEEFAGDARLRILRVPAVGASAARNAGAQASTGAILAFTDDDCEVRPDWLQAMEAGFAMRPEAGIVLGSVLAGDYDMALGFVPACERQQERWHERFEECPEIEVMGASMAVRKSAWDQLGGFWEEIGPGKGVRAGEDFDLVVRALRGGIGVQEVVGAEVLHHGFRTWAEGRQLIEGYAYGTAYVVGYRMGLRPVELGRCLGKFWKSYRGRKSNIVHSSQGVKGQRLVWFGLGLVDGVAGSFGWGRVFG